MKKTITLILISLFTLNLSSQNKDSIIEHLVKKERVLEQDLDSLEHSIEKTKNDIDFLCGFPMLLKANG